MKPIPSTPENAVLYALVSPASDDLLDADGGGARTSVAQAVHAAHLQRGPALLPLLLPRLQGGGQPRQELPGQRFVVSGGR